MSIYLSRRKDGSLKSPYWQFDFVIKINGERRRFHGSTGETKERAAREWEHKEKIRVKSEGPLGAMTLAAACYRYSAERGPNIATADDQDKAFEHCCRLIGNTKRLINITSGDIANAVRLRSMETVGCRKPRSIRPATVNRQIVEPMRSDYVPFVWFLAARGLRVRAAIAMQKFERMEEGSRQSQSAFVI